MPSTNTQKVIILSDKEITIGSDERYADILLQKPSVSPRHARVTRDAQGTFIIADCDSLAGTWLNYTPVTPRGAHLKDGDLVQLGQEVFRFEAAVFTLQTPPTP
jgi:pSer/pThr/pTyr-binding forkhead associated (FHA) protein